jgi:hypothetical protein
MRRPGHFPFIWPVRLFAGMTQSLLAKIRARTVIASLLALGIALPAFADPLLTKARAASIEGPLYTFDVEVADANNRFQMTVDQSKPEGERVTRITPAPSSLKGDAAKKAEMLRKRTNGDIWCNEFLDNIPADAKRASETSSTVTYSFTPVPGEEDGQMRAAYKFLNGTATLDKTTGAVLAYRMSSPKAFKPMAVAKVDHFSLAAACALGPDGRSYITSIDFELQGSAMMQTLNEAERRKVSNLKLAPDSGFGAR